MNIKLWTYSRPFMCAYERRGWSLEDTRTGGLGRLTEEFGMVTPSQCWGLPGRRKGVLVLYIGPQTLDAGVGVSSKTKVNWTTEMSNCGEVNMGCECLKSN